MKTMTLTDRREWDVSVRSARRLAYTSILLGLSALNCSGYDSGPGAPGAYGQTAPPAVPAEGSAKSDAGGGDAAPAADGGTSSSSSKATGVLSVVVANSKFDPPTLTIKAGRAVHWDFQNGQHNVVSGLSCVADGKFTSGATVGAGGVYDRVFPKAGSYDYFCDPHCDHMVGKIIVE